MTNTVPRSHRLADLTLKAMNLGHRVVLKATGNKVMNSLGSMPVVELTTIGRKSGKARSCLLTAPIADENRIVLIASKGGDDRNPDWYQNLVANPDVTVTVNGLTRPMRARTASPQERPGLWERTVSANPGYANYQRHTRRQIPVVICEPR